MFPIFDAGAKRALPELDVWLMPSLGDFPFDLLAAVAKFLRRLLDDALEVDFESAWLIWDLIEIAIFVAATLLLIGLLRHLFRQHADKNDKANVSNAPAMTEFALDAAFETVERLKQTTSSTAARISPANQEIRGAAKLLLSTAADAERRYPLVAAVARCDRLVISQSLVDEFVSLAGESPAFRQRLGANSGNN